MFWYTLCTGTAEYALRLFRPVQPPLKPRQQFCFGHGFLVRRLCQLEFQRFQFPNQLPQLCRTLMPGVHHQLLVHRIAQKHHLLFLHPDDHRISGVSAGHVL